MTHFGLTRDEFGRLLASLDGGRRLVPVDPVRAFPISDPDRFIALVDGEGREVLLIERLDEVPDPERAMLREELARREFIPVIARIVRVHGESHPTEWEVLTDRGPARFTVRGDDDVRRLGPHRALIVDAQGIRYLIPDTRTLDAAGRRILEVWL